MFDGPRHCCGGSPGIEDHHLSGADQARGGYGNFDLFALVQLLFFPKRGIAQRCSIVWQRATVCALQPAHLVERLQILSNRDQGRPETPREILDHHSAVALRQFQDFSPPLFCHHDFGCASVSYYLLLFMSYG